MSELNRISEDICRVFGVSPSAMYSSDRTDAVASARFVVFAILRHGGHHPKAIGSMFGRARTTVIHGLTKIESLWLDRGMAKKLSAIKSCGYKF